MFIVYGFSYSSTYDSVYSTSKERRISLAEKLRKLPLSYFGKKNISDLTSTIMDDCNNFETVFPHAVPDVFAVSISLVVIFIMLFIFNWKLTLSLIWVVPLSAIMVFSSKKMQRKSFKKSYDIRRDVIEDIQEGLENIQEIRSYSEEESYIKNFEKDISLYEKSQIKGELFCGVILNSAQGVLKLGLATVILVGFFLLSNGEIDLFTYLVFIVCASTIYSPVQLYRRTFLFRCTYKSF